MNAHSWFAISTSAVFALPRRRGLRTTLAWAVVGSLALGGACRLVADDFTWSGPSGGTWDTSATNWTGATGTPWDATSGPGNTAVFNAGTTANVPADVFVGGILVPAGTITVQGTGTVRLSGAEPTIGNTSEIRFDTPIAGSFTKSGNGTLFLRGDNSASLAGATVTATAGQLRGYSGNAGSGKEFGDATTTIVIEPGAQIRFFGVTAGDRDYPAALRIAGTGGSNPGALNNDATSNNNLTWSGPITLDADASIGAQNSATYIFNGPISDGGDGYTLTMGLNGGTSTVNGTVSVGNLTISGNGSVVANETITTGSLSRSGNGNLTANGDLTATTVSKAGNGTLSFGGASVVEVDAWNLNGGNLRVDRTGIIGPGDTIIFGGGTLQQNGADTADYSSQFTAAPNQTFRIDTGANTLTWASDLVSADGNLGKAGSGTLILSGSNTLGSGTFSFGGTNVNGGYVQPTNPDAFGSLGAIALSGQNAGVSGIRLAGGLTFATPLRTNGRDNGTGAGAMIRNLADDNTWNGNVTMSGGGGTYGFVADAGSLTLGGTITSSVTGLAAARTLGFAGAGDFIVSGDIVKGVGADGSLDIQVSKTGAGTLTLAGSNDYGGTTTVSGGRLLVNGVNAGSGPVSVGGSGTLGGTGSIAGEVTINDGGTLAPGVAIGVLATGGATLQNGSSFAYGIDSAAAPTMAGDLLRVTGDLTLAGAVTLAVEDLAVTPEAFPIGTTLSVINYSGSWNTGLFSIGGDPLPDGGQFTVGPTTWQIEYAAITGGLNQGASGLSGSFVNITAVPEPAGFLLAVPGLGLMGWSLRRWLRRRV
jgi:fibronectin-binding autotransporter adhesin